MERTAESCMKELATMINEQKQEFRTHDGDGAIIAVKIREYKDKTECSDYRLVWPEQPNPVLSLRNAIADGYQALGLLVRAHSNEGTHCTTKLVGGWHRKWARYFLDEITIDLQRESERQTSNDLTLIAPAKDCERKDAFASTKSPERLETLYELAPCGVAPHPHDLAANLKQLDRDRHFVQDIAHVRTLLRAAMSGSAVNENDKTKADAVAVVEQFLTEFRFPIGPNTPLRFYEFTTRHDLPDTVEAAFQSYISFAQRYRVALYYDKTTAEFYPKALPVTGPAIHGEIRNGELCPCGVFDEDADVVDSFDGTDLDVLPELRRNDVRFFQIDDAEQSSTLTEIESVGYFHAGVTVILHRAEYPYLLLMIGENVSDTALRKILPAIGALQKKYHGRVHRGRPRDISKLKKDLETLGKDVPQFKHQVLERTPSTIEKDIASTQRRLLRLRAEMKKPRK